MLGSSKRDVCRGLIQLATRPCVILHRDKVNAYHRSTDSPLEKESEKCNLSILDNNLTLERKKNDSKDVIVDIDKKKKKFSENVDKSLQNSETIPEEVVHQFDTEMLMLDDVMVSKISRSLEEHQTHHNDSFYDLMNGWQKNSSISKPQIPHSNKIRATSEIHSRIKHTKRSTHSSNAAKEKNTCCVRKKSLDLKTVSAEFRKSPKDRNLIENENSSKSRKNRIRAKFREYFGSFVSLSEEEQEESILKNRNQKRKRKNLIDLNNVQTMKKIQRALPVSMMQEAKENSSFNLKVKNREKRKFKEKTSEKVSSNQESSMETVILMIDNESSQNNEAEQNQNCVPKLNAENDQSCSYDMQNEHNCSAANAEKCKNISAYDTTKRQNCFTSNEKNDKNCSFDVETNRNSSICDVEESHDSFLNTEDSSSCSTFNTDKIKNISALVVDESEGKTCNFFREENSTSDLEILSIVEEELIKSEDENTSTVSKNEGPLAVDSKDDLLNLLHMNFDTSFEFTAVGNHVSIRQSNKEKTTADKGFNHILENSETNFSSMLNKKQKFVPHDEMEKNRETSRFCNVNAEKAENLNEKQSSLSCKQRLRVLSSAELGSKWHLTLEAQGISSEAADVTRIEEHQNPPPSENTQKISRAEQSLQNSQKISTTKQSLENCMKNSITKHFLGSAPNYSSSYSSRTGLEPACPEIQFDHLPKSDRQTVELKTMHNLKTFVDDFAEKQKIEYEVNSQNKPKLNVETIKSKMKNMQSSVQQNLDPDYSNMTYADLSNFFPSHIYQTHAQTPCNDLYPRVTTVEKIVDAQNLGLKYLQSSAEPNLNLSYSNNNYGSLANILPTQIHQKHIQTHCNNPHSRITGVKSVIESQTARIESLQSSVQPNMNSFSSSIDYGDLANFLPIEVHQTHGQPHSNESYLKIIAVKNNIKAQNCDTSNLQNFVQQSRNPNYSNNNYGDLSKFLPTQIHQMNINVHCNDPYFRTTAVEKIVKAQNSRIKNPQISMQPNLNQSYLGNNYGSSSNFLPTQIHQTRVHAHCPDCYPQVREVQKGIETQNSELKNPENLSKKRTVSSFNLSAKNKIKAKIPRKISEQQKMHTKSNYEYLKCFTGIQKFMLLKQLDFYLDNCSKFSYISTNLESQRFVLIAFRQSLLNYQAETLMKYNAEQKKKDRIINAKSGTSTLKNAETIRNIKQKPYEKATKDGKKFLVDPQKDFTSNQAISNFVEEKNISSKSIIMIDKENLDKNGSNISQDSSNFDSTISQGGKTMQEELDASSMLQALKVKKPVISSMENEISSSAQMVTIEISNSDRIKVIASDEKNLQNERTCNFEKNMAEVNLCNEKEEINVSCKRNTLEKIEALNLNKVKAEMHFDQNCTIDENNVSVKTSDTLNSMSIKDEKGCINIEDVRSIPFEVFKNMNEEEKEIRVDLDRNKKKICLQCCEISTVVCGNCFMAHYCSQTCASTHWNSAHHSLCKRITPDALSNLLYLTDL
ncbi:hypothetical protein KM043_004777 [Ampulex compressa]|nr:hypothetical protein KM043_004777 [Ampulex compressa]